MMATTQAPVDKQQQQPQPPRRGAFIVFEGIDRCGKSTQTALLAASLPNSLLRRFPDRTTKTGAIISSYLSHPSSSSASSPSAAATPSPPLPDEAIHLLFSANRWESAASLTALLRAGTNVIVDRYAYSGAAYTAAKGGGGGGGGVAGGLGLEWCKAPDRGLPTPDLVVYVDVAPAVAAARAGYGEERYERIEFQEKVAAAFAELRDERWVVVDGTRPVEEVQRTIEKVAREVVAKAGMEPLREDLWC
ncbi:hypothetical protein HDU87_001950 [Geranomyces variabilis]|uniref:Thymidylate kinase n=1 Tax=Geranomyces variabilis TaxID=109894 RepID=A0AAD5XNJ5_9FUNG|nr:hypothetical protein HDU87_001950 [Geranomyces variabilis]